MDKTYQILEIYRESVKDEQILEFIDSVLKSSELMYSKALLSRLEANKSNLDKYSKEEQNLINEVLYECK